MDDQEVKFSMKETRRYATITAAIKGRLSNEAAAHALGVSVRQVRRPAAPCAFVQFTFEQFILVSDGVHHVLVHASIRVIKGSLSHLFSTF